MRLIDADRAMEIVRDQGIAHPNAYHLTNYATLILRNEWFCANGKRKEGAN